MGDIFGRASTVLGGALTSDATRMTFSSGMETGETGTGLILQQVQCQYGQQISMLYALENNKAYFVAGRTQGQMAVNQIFGPNAIVAQFFKNYGNVCRVNNGFMLEAVTGCADSERDPDNPISPADGLVGEGPRRDANRLKLNIEYPSINQLTFNVSTENMTITGGVQMQFLGMNIDDGSSNN